MPDYILNTPEQQEAMLAAISARSVEDLFADIPQTIRLQQPLDLPPELGEMQLASQLKAKAARNTSLDEQICFLGAGAYDHYVPAAVKNLLGRQEFYTAYTPYQPEISQGTLQAIFEYQTMICELTGMDIANASMYDGASALAEAALMACQATHRNRILAAASLHPDSLAVLQTYARFSGMQIDLVPWQSASGQLDLTVLEEHLSDDVAAVLIQYPGFFGVIDPLSPIAALAHARQALLIVSADPIALGLLSDPGSAGADIVVGEGQALGNGLNFGGPYLGFFAARQELMRRMPGRIVGETLDARGRRSYVLTIQTREQHIRRGKATSNICTNEALNALAAAIYLSLAGPAGLHLVAQTSLGQAHKLHDRLVSLPHFEPLFHGPFFKEFAVRFKGNLAALNESLSQAGFVGGLDVASIWKDMGGVWLLAVTERRTDEEIDRFVHAVEAHLAGRGQAS